MLPLYKNIKKFRTQLGLSQDAFAKLIGYTDRSSVAKIETGKVDLSQSKIKTIADVLGVTVSELMGDALPPLPELEPYRPKSQMPLLGRVAAGLPMYAEENIEGYIANDFTDGENYYALRVCGDSMNAAGIDAGDIVVVRQQSTVDEHEVGVILVNGNDATIKYFRQQGSMAILSPRSTNPIHQVQIYDIRETTVRIIGRVVQIRKNI